VCVCVRACGCACVGVCVCVRGLLFCMHACFLHPRAGVDSLGKEKLLIHLANTFESLVSCLFVCLFVFLFFWSCLLLLVSCFLLLVAVRFLLALLLLVTSTVV